MLHFDRELVLADLLPPQEAERLCSSVGVLLGVPVALLDATSSVVAGSLDLADDTRAEIVLELEPIGYLAAPGAAVVAKGATASLIRQILLARGRYLMASRVHAAATQADYEELQRQNEALRTSESQLKALAAELEERVAEQVEIIDQRQRQLYEAEHMAAVGQLAAGVAHEINNPIGFVRSNLGTARNYLAQIGALAHKVRAQPGGAELLQAADIDFMLADFDELLSDSIAGADRVARIVADLKGFSSIDKPEETFADINQIIDSACHLVEPRLVAGGRLIRNFGLPVTLLCLPGHLAQVMLALLDNAVLAIIDRGDKGEIRVRTGRENDQLLIEVRDNGPGIPDEILKRVFEPFFTTRPVGKGTGLGLTVALDIVKHHGGTLTLKSLVGVGTVATLTLPTSQEMQ